MECILLQRGGWNRGSIASDNCVWRNSLLDPPDHLPFDTKIFRDAFDDDLALLQDGIVFRNGQLSQNLSRI